jgi:hypothetical protein
MGWLAIDVFCAQAAAFGRKVRPAELQAGESDEEADG